MGATTPGTPGYAARAWVGREGDAVGQCDAEHGREGDAEHGREGDGMGKQPEEEEKEKDKKKKEKGERRKEKIK